MWKGFVLQQSLVKLINFMKIDHSKKQLEILEKAAALFRDKGYAATSMRELAQAVNLKVSSIYSHFSSKEAILQVICFENAQKFTQNMASIEAQYNNPLQQLEALINLHIEIALEDTTSVTAFNDEWRHLGEARLEEFLSLRKEYEMKFCAIIEAGIAEGTIQDIQPQTIFYTILSSIRWLYDWYKPNKKLEAILIKEQVLRLLLRGIVSE